MRSISGNGTIELTRGDSFQFPIWINVGTNIKPDTYFMNEDDFIYFGLMEPHQNFEHAILRKKLTSADQDASGNIVVSLKPQDTVCLLPGKYYYQVKLQQGAADVITLVDKTQFFILE